MTISRVVVTLFLVTLVLLVAGCTLSGGDDDKDQPAVPTVGTPVVILNPTQTPLPTVTATLTTTVAVSNTPAPTLTPMITAGPTTSPVPTTTPTTTPAPTATSTPFEIVIPATNTYTPFPAPTAVVTQGTVPTQAVIPAQTAVPQATYPQPPTFTPVVYQTNTPLPTAVQPTVVQPTAMPGAAVCGICGGLRLRETPGTAGNILGELDAYTPLQIIGRTEDNKWVQVVLQDGQNGWVSVGYLAVYIDLDTVSVTGVAEDAVVVDPLAGNGVVSGISANARTIFLDGLAKGNNPYVFTRVGDSISASPNFLTPIGRGNYNLGEYGYLGDAISFFSGPNGRGANPFAALSLAARNGWSTESVLNPSNADPNVCRTGETPLECEYRLVKPAVALIMFGTNDSGGMPSATFQANLQTIVNKSINMGVIPVLSTIPPKHYNPATDGRVFEFNQIIIATARAYDIPLWDYYSAMAALPGEGLSPDGVHPSPAWDGLNAVFDAQHLQYGYPMRNFTALQVLYALWQYVLYDAGTVTPATSVPPQPGDPATGCPGAPAPRLTVGGQGRVTPGVPNKMRNSPGTAGAQIGSIPGEGVFTVVAGPQCADGYLWWQVNYEGTIGWTANGGNGEYWVEPYP